MNGHNTAKISNYILKLLYYDSGFMPKSFISLLLQYGKVQATPYKMASEMGLEALLIGTCYKMAGHGKVISYKMALEIDHRGQPLHRGNFNGGYVQYRPLHT